MKAIKLFLNYKADEKYDNKLFEGLLEMTIYSSTMYV